MRVKLYARNIVNKETVKEYLLELSKNIDIVEVKKWINSNLKNYIQEDLETVTKVTKYKESDPDWLKDGVKEGTALEVELKDGFKEKVLLILNYFNSLPTKELNKLSKVSFNVADTKSYLWKQKITYENSQDIPEESKDVRIVRKYKDGYKWVKILTEKSLQREGILMNNCLKNDSDKYTKVFNSGWAEFFSLRDDNNKPHCTLQVTDKTCIGQIKGYSNGSLKEKYVLKLKNFIESPMKGRKFEEIHDLWNIGILDQDGKWYNIYNLQPNFTVNRVLVFPDGEIEIKIPKNLTVNGTLEIHIVPCSKLPENLSVEDFYIFGTMEKLILQKGLNVDNIFTVDEESPIEIIFCSSPDISIHNLSIENSNVKKLEFAKNTELYEITAYDSKIISISDNLTVDSLNLEGAPIKKLPNNLTVRKNLNIENTNIKSLPKDLIVHGKIYKNF